MLPLWILYVSTCIIIIIIVYTEIEQLSTDLNLADQMALQFSNTRQDLSLLLTPV
jgi:hypothetical protein